MRSLKILFTLGAVAAAGLAATTIAAHAERRAVPASEDVRVLFTDLEAAVKREFAHGCTEDDGAGGLRLCGDSRNTIDAMHDEAEKAADAAKARPENERAAAVAAVRSLRQDAGLRVSYLSTSPNPAAAVSPLTPLHRLPAGAGVHADDVVATHAAPVQRSTRKLAGVPPVMSTGVPLM